MKILLVSMNSIHLTRWAQQLRDSGHEVHWFNVYSSEYNSKLDFVTQHSGWKYRVKKGRFLIKKIPFIKKMNERNLALAFEKVLDQVQPDIVHSFALYVACTPILEVMKKNNNLPWVYSSWGSDLFFYKNLPAYRKDIEAVLPRVNYLFTDCNRDQNLAREMGFKGETADVFPGGGGFDMLAINKIIKTPLVRKMILIKGYQGRSGRAIQVLKALKNVNTSGYEIVVFACAKEVKTYGLENNIPATYLEQVSHDEVLKFMGAAYVYIGNSNSDGMPNTLLEAICCGAFPIQSNPGGASAEVITDGKNGLLINDCEDVAEITRQIQQALNDNAMVADAFQHNQEQLKPTLGYDVIRDKVLSVYQEIADACK